MANAWVSGCIKKRKWVAFSSSVIACVVYSTTAQPESRESSNPTVTGASFCKRSHNTRVHLHGSKTRWHAC